VTTSSNDRQSFVNDPAERRAKAVRGTPGLIEAARAGELRLAVVFGGQGASSGSASCGRCTPPTPRCGRSSRPPASGCAPRRRIPGSGALATPARGFDLARWMDDPAAAPPPDVLSSSLVSQAGIFLTSVARLLALGERGSTSTRSASVCTAATGHSQGVMAALLFAEGREPERLVRPRGRDRQLLLLAGLPDAGVLRAGDGAPGRARGGGAGRGGRPSPMAAVAGLTSERLAEALARFHAANPQLPPIDVALDNGYARKVRLGPARGARGLRARARRLPRRREAGLRPGQARPPPHRFPWEFVAASAPFHSRYMDAGRRALPDDLAREGIVFAPDALRLPVLGNDGTDLRCTPTRRRAAGDARAHAARRAGALGRRVRGAAASHPEGVTHVLDFGPGDAVAKLTALNCRGFGVHVFPLATRPARDVGWDPPRAAPRPGLPTLRPDAAPTPRARSCSTTPGAASRAGRPCSCRA
jgi:fatty acid synthase